MLVLVCIFSGCATNMTGAGKPGTFIPSKLQSIDPFVQKQFSKQKMPGLSVIIVKEGRTSFYKGYGYANVKTKESVNPDTLFELGATSEAFTALGILLLEERRLLNIHDEVNKYLPWFTMRYQGKDTPVTIRQLLYHTSGMPFQATGDIPVGDTIETLEETVKTLRNKNLDFYPGRKFQYAAINYDILGLIIQEISGQPYEEFMKSQVIQPLGLDHTYLFRKEAEATHNIAKGYKWHFLNVQAYDPPAYRGNTPSFNYISNAGDIAAWLKIQTGASEVPPEFQSIIESSQLPDRTVGPYSDGSSFAAGWAVFQKESGEMARAGNTPIFSSYFVVRPKEKLGVAVLTNINSNCAKDIGQSIMDILHGEAPQGGTADMFRNFDKISFIIICMLSPLIITIIILFILAILQIGKKERNYAKKGLKGYYAIAAALLIISALWFCLQNIPKALFNGLPWSYFHIWAPESLNVAMDVIKSAVILFCGYFLCGYFFPKKDEKAYFSLVLLVIMSAFGNALIISIVNGTLNGANGGYQNGLAIFFLFGILLYLLGQKLLRTRFIYLTNTIIYSKRKELTEKILNTSFQKFEGIESGRIYAGLNNDTEVISEAANLIILGATASTTILCCFIYLGILYLWGLLIALSVIMVAMFLYFKVGQKARLIWNQTRDIQNTFFKFISDLINGFKELAIHEDKREEFKDDMLQKCNLYKEKRIAASLKFANVFILGEFLFIAVIGAVTFLFPYLFNGISNGTLRSFVIIFLYMSSPVYTLLNTIPNIIQVKISWERISGLIRQLSLVESKFKLSETKIEDEVVVDLKDLYYEYKDEQDKVFSVGPINYQFKSGEIVFITGGNGSGKSTLAKLITGLYPPDSGEILINHKRVEPEGLGRYYSAIFSDSFIFGRLYGIDYANKEEMMQKYLKILRIDDKLTIDDGVFSKTKLSSGQRKRLALLVSYLEDRPIYLFDEWAADQDPEFRKFFYHTLIFDLKNLGKCVIAITHDDRYFDLADKVIKMDMGKITEDKNSVVHGSEK